MGMAVRLCPPLYAMIVPWTTPPGPARPLHREPARGAGLPQPHRPGQQPAVHRAHAVRHRAGVRKASPGTYAMLENKLAWAPGSIDPILAGENPRERDPTTPANPRRSPTTPTDVLSRASTEELLLELRRRIVAPRQRRHQTSDDWTTA